MAGCGYKTQVLGEEVRCRLDALPGEGYCYWHKKEDGKEPTEEQLEELRRDGILNAYLRGADLGEANLQGARLSGADLRGAWLLLANLWGTELIGADLRGADLSSADLRKAMLPAELFGSPSRLQGAKLSDAKLQGAELTRSRLQGADLSSSHLQGATLLLANLQGADLHHARFDSKTVLDRSILVGANLFHSYFDEAKSFRNATVFQNGGDKEINEIVGDALACWFTRILENDNEYLVKIISKIISFVLNKNLNKKLQILLPLKPAVFDMDTIEKKAPDVAAKLHGNGLIRYVRYGKKIIFFDWSSGCVIQNPENPRQDRSLIRIKELTDLILKDGKIQPEFLYDGGRASLYEASYEIYNNLYNFYTANGRLDQAVHVHYRRGEAHRKLRRARGADNKHKQQVDISKGEVHRKLGWARGKWKNWTRLKYKMRSIFDLVILRTLTGYGDRILRPIRASVVIILGFALGFFLTDGIVKNVNVISINGTSNDTVKTINITQVAPDWWDYIYHSITTFTSLGYSNIQPNLASEHWIWPQVLVAAESGLGILMMALIIFVVTYQVSR